MADDERGEKGIVVGIELGLTARPRQALSLNRVIEGPAELAGPDEPGQEPSGPPPRSTVRILALSFVFGSMAAILTVVRVAHLHRLPGPTHVAWWLLTLGFAVTEVFAVKLDIRRQTHSFSLIELPLVVGFFFVSPLGLVTAWVDRRRLRARRVPPATTAETRHEPDFVRAGGGHIGARASAPSWDRRWVSGPEPGRRCSFRSCWPISSAPRA